MRLALGKKQAEQAVRWVGTLSTFGATSALAACYFTEWKTVLQYVPFYGSKYDEEKSE